jgi:hypothetical protein
VSARNPGVPPDRLAAVLERSRCHKGRLLHYFPPPPSADGGEAAASGEAGASGEASERPDSWCGWHTDHGSLTGARERERERAGWPPTPARASCARRAAAAGLLPDLAAHLPARSLAPPRRAAQA